MLELQGTEQYDDSAGIAIDKGDAAKYHITFETADTSISGGSGQGGQASAKIAL
jgi:hypothetical protein